MRPRLDTPNSDTNPSGRNMDREDLAQAILDLENGLPDPIEDPQLAYELGHHVKPVIDLLSNNEGSEVSVSDPLSLDTAILAPEDRKVRRRRAIKKRPLVDGPMPDLQKLATEDKARWLLMDRFISLDQHEEILSLKFSTEERQAHIQDLDRLITSLLVLPQVTKLLAAAKLFDLQKIFSSHLLLFRNPTIDTNQLPCNLENLRNTYPAYFYKRHKTPNWYEAQDFYTSPIDRPHWALCGFDFLNCTLRRPDRKLANHAGHWSLPTSYVRQKTALEDVYDRILSGEALKEHLFEQNCNSCCSTRYQHQSKRSLRMVYIVQKDQKIAIHGKNGLPHWKASKRSWPGVYPSIVAPRHSANNGES